MCWFSTPKCTPTQAASRRRQHLSEPSPSSLRLAGAVASCEPLGCQSLDFIGAFLAGGGGFHQGGDAFADFFGAIGAIAKFASSGKRIRKKDLGLIATTYGYVYVAQVAMGADQAQTLKAIREAEAYDGPSLMLRRVRKLQWDTVS